MVQDSTTIISRQIADIKRRMGNLIGGETDHIEVDDLLIESIKTLADLSDDELLRSEIEVMLGMYKNIQKLYA